MYSWKMLTLLIHLSVILGLSSCRNQTTLYIGTMKGPETELFKVIKKLALHHHGIRIHLIEFNHHTHLNHALLEKNIDANAFQHSVHLEEVLKKTTDSSRLHSLSKHFIYPLSIYSSNITHLEDLKQNDTVGIAMDRSNQDRALRFLENCKLITLNKFPNQFVNIDSVRENRKQLQFKLFDVASLNDHLDDCCLIVMDNYYAASKALTANQHALVVEDHYIARRYANLFVVRKEDQNKNALKKIADLLRAEEVIQKAQQLFHEVMLSY